MMSSPMLRRLIVPVFLLSATAPVVHAQTAAPAAPMNSGRCSTAQSLDEVSVRAESW